MKGPHLELVWCQARAPGDEFFTQNVWGASDTPIETGVRGHSRSPGFSSAKIFRQPPENTVFGLRLYGSSSREDRKRALTSFSVVYFSSRNLFVSEASFLSRGTLPTKKKGEKGTTGPLFLGVAGPRSHMCLNVILLVASNNCETDRSSRSDRRTGPTKERPSLGRCHMFRLWPQAKSHFSQRPGTLLEAMHLIGPWRPTRSKN